MLTAWRRWLRAWPRSCAPGARKPLDSCRLVVQHRGMQRWLSLYIADSEGVCANLRYQFPAAFIWEQMRAALDEPAAPYYYTPQALCWRLLDVLHHLPQDAVYSELRRYLTDAGPGARYELAVRLAEVYDRYLVYRPDWIDAWESGRKDHWQACLWRKLAAGGEHWVSMARRFREAVQAGRVATGRLPQMACMFGVPALSPGYLEVLKVLAGPMDLHLFLLDPCREYWGDLESPARAAKAVMEERPGAESIQVGNSLLAGLGRQGRDFLDAVHGLEPGHEEELYEPPGRADRLHCLQADLLELAPGGPAPADAVSEDPSVQVHACHGPMRELEVLHDRLLDLFERWPDLKPSDVVVMTPDVQRYAPLVEAVFDTASPRIPYELTDRAPLTGEPAALALFTLLALPESRLEAEEVLQLLALAPVRQRAGIAEEELPRLRQWLRRAGVRWGVDQHHRAGLQLPAEQTHTWRHGLDRLLLGCALPEDLAQPFAGHAPCADLEGDEARLLGRLCRFFDRLAELREMLERDTRRPQKLDYWRATLRRVIQEFLHSPDDAVDMLGERIEDWCNDAGGTAPVLDLADLRAGLRHALEAETSSGRFPGAGVSFCRMVPMRSVPFAVVCLLGLDFDAYPRTFHPPSFDRSARAPRSGDRRQRDDDRYLFLEALLSARRCLYISYTGRDPHDDSERPPSVVVSELLAYLGRHYGVATDTGGMPGGALIQHHPLQPFSERYFADTREPGLYSYSEAALATCRALRAGVGPDVAFVSAPAPTDETSPAQVAELADLEEFCGGGARFYLQQRLNIYAPRLDASIVAEEPFVPPERDKARLRELLLRAELQGAPAPLAGVRAAGMLPHGDAGTAVLDRAQRTVQDFIDSMDAAVRQAAAQTSSQAFDLQLGTVRLTGSLPWLSAAGAVYLYPRKPWESELMILWLRHLVLSLCPPDGMEPLTRLAYLARDGATTRHFHHCLQPVDDAAQQLSVWLQYCRQGLTEPLPLLPRSSMAYARARAGDRQTDPMQNARNAWLGGIGASGEQEDFYNRLAFRGRPEPLRDERFPVLADALLLPLQRALA